MSKDRFFLLDAGASRPTSDLLPPGATLKAGAHDTEGRFVLVEARGAGGIPAQVLGATHPFGISDASDASGTSGTSGTSGASAAFDAFVYVLDGDLGIDVDGRTHHLTGGMCALISRGVTHVVHNLGGAESAVHALRLSATAVAAGEGANHPEADGADAPERFFVLPRGAARPGRIAVPPAFSIKARTADTAGLFSFLEVTVAQPIPRHTHHVADECIYVLEGELHIDFGERLHTARQGQFVLLPRGVPHAIRPGSNPPPRVLQISSPGGWECVVETLIEHRTEVSRAGRFDPAALNRYTREHGVTYEEGPANG
ncbi:MULTISPECIES: cupin domain-containing protein [unclassified Streptomyces]|uniref:cupin domain-containing protein n=1 Tax=unclassified Streptomyces TaxID=2593676 RepID=UPI000381B234|nr:MULTISPECIES: cupin domain-containing protein [unclassified Streptomyces]MYT29917.1 cupin domain-containing protein [Streptomyces sp. SID8354]